MANLERVHRFRGHAVAGVNWRQTRFVDEVPSLRVCGLCRMIPTRIVVLPCSHTLCQSCLLANSQGGVGRCPLDQELFDGNECSGYELPTRKANAFKVYCWNEEFGCRFEDAMEDMLRHYDKECAYHVVECLRCGNRVLHSELSTHYTSGCSAGSLSAGTVNTPPESAALTPQAVIDAFEGVKTLLRDPNNEHLLSTIQSHINELTEIIRNQDSTSTFTTRSAETSVTADNAVQEAPNPSTVFQEPAPEQTRAAEASSSSSPLPGSQEMWATRIPDAFAHLPRSALRDMRKTSSHEYPQHAIDHRNFPNVKCHLSLRAPLSTTRTWTEVQGSVNYILTLVNVHISSNPFASTPVQVAEVTVLHTEDAYFVVDVRQWCRGILGKVVFHGIGARSPNPSLVVRAYDWRKSCMCFVHSSKEPCACNVDSNTWLHSRVSFDLVSPFLPQNTYLRDGKVILEIEVSRR